MSRRITSTQFQSSGSGEVDGFFDRLVKYIPSDIVAAWIVTKNLVASNPTAPPQVLWVCFAAGLILTALVVRFPPKGGPASWTQVAISVVAFAIWTWAIGAPLATAIPLSSLYSSLVLIAYTILVAIFVPSPSNPIHPPPASATGKP